MTPLDLVSCGVLFCGFSNFMVNRFLLTPAQEIFLSEWRSAAWFHCKGDYIISKKLKGLNAHPSPPSVLVKPFRIHKHVAAHSIWIPLAQLVACLLPLLPFLACKVSLGLNLGLSTAVSPSCCIRWICNHNETSLKLEFLSYHMPFDSFWITHVSVFQDRIHNCIYRTKDSCAGTKAKNIHHNIEE